LNLQKRLFVSVGRNLGKTVVLFVLVLALGCVASGAILAKRAAQNASDNIRANLPAIVSIDLDQRALNEHYNATGEHADFDNAALEILAEIAALPYVKNYDISTTVGLFSRDLEQVVLDDAVETGWEPWTHLNAKSIQGSTIFDQEEGLIEIVLGRKPTEYEIENQSHIAIISEEFAHLNRLGIGSVLSLENILWKYEGLLTQSLTEENIFARQAYDFEVIGIFESLVAPNTGYEWVDFEIAQSAANRVYLPIGAVVSAQLFLIEKYQEMNPEAEWAQENPEDLLIFYNVYHLKDLRELENFKSSVEDIVPEFWTVITISSSFDQVDASLQTVSELATLVLWVAVAASIFILNLLTILFVIDRKHEIGIYLALGEKKSRVITQVALEMLGVALLAIILSLLAGNVLADNISENMFRADMASAAEQTLEQGTLFSDLDHMGFFPGENAEEMLARYDVSLDVVSVLIFFAASIGTILMSTIMPMLYILRLNPKRIML